MGWKDRRGEEREQNYTVPWVWQKESEAIVGFKSVKNQNENEHC